VGDQRVTAVIVNYRSGDDLARCLPGVLAGGSSLARVVVFDNDSGDDSIAVAESLARSDDRIEIVRSGTNLGLAGAVNQVLPTVATEYLAVLNPDSTPLEGWLQPLVDSLDSDPGAAAACPLVLMEGSGEVNSAGQHVHVTGLGFNRLLHGRPETVPGEPQPVGGLHGVAFLIRTAMLRDLGGWDSTGFLYHEDVALSWDLLLGGHDILCVPESRVLHDYHLTMYPEKLYLLERNRWALLLSHLRWRRLLLLTPALILTEVMVWGLALVRGRGFIRAKTSAYAWVRDHRREVADWRERVFARPTYDAARLRRGTRWSYPLLQLGLLGGERGESTRRPPGGLPHGGSPTGRRS
jgi:GT2 family glycosyltransferase